MLAEDHSSRKSGFLNRSPWLGPAVNYHEGTLFLQQANNQDDDASHEKDCSNSQTNKPAS